MSEAHAVDGLELVCIEEALVTLSFRLGLAGRLLLEAGKILFGMRSHNGSLFPLHTTHVGHGRASRRGRRRDVTRDTNQRFYSSTEQFQGGGGR